MELFSSSKITSALVAVLFAAATFAAAPAPEKIFEDHIKALGGEAAIRAIKTRYFDGTMDNRRTKAISRISAWQRAPNQSLTEIETLGVGTFTQGFDGKEPWSKDIKGVVKTLTGSEGASVMDSALMYGDLEWKSRYTDVKTVGDTTFEAKPAVEISVKTGGGGERSIFFDPKTWLQLGVKETILGPNGPDGKPQKQFLTTVFDEYREVGGVKTVTKFTQKVGELEIILIFKVLDVNTELKVIFDKPAGTPAVEPAPATPPVTEAPKK